MSTILEINRVKPTTGDVGIEIEIEGANLPQTIDYYWRVETDGSLRGEAFEYVLSKPLPRDKYQKALAHLVDQFTAKKAVVHDTIRAGIHVHVNYQQMTPTQVLNSLTIYFIVEDLLTHLCGKSREGNLFCLRASDAEDIIRTLEDNNGDFTRMGNDTFRYAAVNLKALATYGSLEYRAMRSTMDMDGVVTPWVELLLKIRDKCVTFKNPAEVMQKYSELGAEDFLHYVFEELADLLIHDLPLKDSMQQGAWRVQLMAFSIDTEALEKRLGKSPSRSGTKTINWGVFNGVVGAAPNVPAPVIRIRDLSISPETGLATYRGRPLTVARDLGVRTMLRQEYVPERGRHEFHTTLRRMLADFDSHTRGGWVDILAGLGIPRILASALYLNARNLHRDNGV